MSSRTLPPARRIAIIGAGPAGAITLDAVLRENTATTITLFERHAAPGGCWLGDAQPPPLLTNQLAALATRTADPPLPTIPTTPLPARTPRSGQPRFAEGSVYPYLETNVDASAMSFTGGGAEDVPATVSAWSRGVYGEGSVFRHWTVMRDYVQGLFARHGDGGERFAVRYGASVERVVKDDGAGEWVVTVRTEDGGEDVWDEERFDAVVVAGGHFNVPWIPAVEGLEEFERAWPGSVVHSKMYRGRDAFRGKVSSPILSYLIPHRLHKPKVLRCGKG